MSYNTLKGLTGIFGKLPAHGDFIHRHLPTQFTSIWDEWLQNYIAGSKEQLGENWLDIYLTSPIWRFSLSSGSVDEHQWGGIIIPSVDRVGRYFPFSVVTRIPAEVIPLVFMIEHELWFKQIERIALQALHGELTADDSIEAINQIPLGHTRKYQRSTAHSNMNIVIPMADEKQQALSAMPYMLDSYLNNIYASYSIWSTSGSEYVAPCLLTTQNLPPLNGIAAMLDGRWQERQWQQPFCLHEEYINE